MRVAARGIINVLSNVGEVALTCQKENQGRRFVTSRLISVHRVAFALCGTSKTNRPDAFTPEFVLRARVSTCCRGGRHEPNLTHITLCPLGGVALNDIVMVSY